MKHWELIKLAKADSKHLRRFEQRKHDDKILERQAEDRERKLRAKKSVGINTYLDIPTDLEVSDEDIAAVLNNREFNDTYSEYLMRRFEETNRHKYANRSESMTLCNKLWSGDRYTLQRIFDVKNVSLCHDKFCVNCQHLKQSHRLKLFEAMLPELSDKYDPYHLSITVPNVEGAKLKSTVAVIFEAFKKLIRYLSGNAKIKGIDFTQYGYAGAARCLEIIANPNDDYHPHIHCLLLLCKGLGLHKHIVNTYSYDKHILTRKFSDFEVQIQKIFYLLVNGVKVTKKNIEALPLGYSCVMNQVEADNKSWHDVFKYITKLSKNGEPSLSYEQFCTLDDVLYRRKVMQGYGVLYSVTEDEDGDDELYEQVIVKLGIVEDPIDSTYPLEKLHDEVRVENVKVISKRNKYALQNIADMQSDTD